MCWCAHPEAAHAAAPVITSVGEFELRALCGACMDEHSKSMGEDYGWMWHAYVQQSVELAEAT